MIRRFLEAGLIAALGLAIAQAQTQTPAPTADPYANNADAGKLQFPHSRSTETIPPVLPNDTRAPEVD